MYVLLVISSCSSIRDAEIFPFCKDQCNSSPHVYFLPRCVFLFCIACKSDLLVNVLMVVLQLTAKYTSLHRD